MHKRIVTRKSVSNLPSPVDDGKSNTIIPVPRVTYRHRRKCERPNYIPHRSPNYDNRNEWSDAYDPQLFTMYRIIGRMIDSEFPKVSIDWRNPKYYRALNKLIYHCSSRYISPYIDKRDDLTSSKDLSDDDKGWEKQKGN